ncbi:hypothetical protein, partial [Staphylococcus aureus]|uniref:hypothetical protein n=1 Tax=Staphylococcus aureus TaxID=1280 RepID=UPI000C0E9973
IVLPSTDDELKVLNTIRFTPTQDFLAAQHERFSRFVQAMFQPHTSYYLKRPLIVSISAQTVVK